MGELQLPSRSRRDVAVWLYLTAGTAVIVFYFVTSSRVRFMLAALLSASAVVAIVVGVSRNKPPSRVPWYLFAAGMAPYAAADTIWGLYQVRDVEVPFPGVADILYLAAYLLFAAGLVTLARKQAGRLRWAGLLDAGIVTLGFASLAWVFIMAPYLRSDLSVWPLAVSIAYPATDLLLLSMAARLLLTTGTRTPSFLLCIAWLIATLFADGLYYGSMATTGTAIGEDATEVVWMVSYLFLGAAALHPSVARTSELAQNQERLSRHRLALLMGLTLMGPLIVLFDVAGIRDQPVDVAVIVGMMASLSLLLLLRVALLAEYAQGRATEARTQAYALKKSLREQTVLQTQLSFQAHHDPLTGLANRALLNDRLDHALGENSNPSTAGLLMLDLDGFKEINDALGHSVGDEVLVDVAQRLQSGVRRQDTVARLGGDEFALLVEGVGESTLRDYAARILDAFKDPFALSSGHTVSMTTSIGARTITEPTPPSEALRDADAALYVAKSEGKNRAVFFEATRISRQKHAEITQALRHAFIDEEFTVQYEPVANLRTGETAGVQAVLRWRHGGSDPIPPEQFVKIAEETEMIVPIGAWGLREACRQGRQWHDRGPFDPWLTIASSVSHPQLKDPAFPEGVANILRETGFPATALVLEVTEADLISGAEIAAVRLAPLRTLGVRISIGGFGTGYSSLAYLRSFPVDMVKIDRSLVHTDDTEKTEREEKDTLVRAILHVAEGLGLDTIAEGIETPEQAERLLSLGCLHGQGSHYAAPMTWPDLERYLARHPLPELPEQTP